ncbi:hypothetical protein BDY24DRAFT_239374 [Mrakia frigida]|uniref:uncharacterized protein n=1 Tax=Mrakia frigida TaxID=29902 RepID=UPI003FCC0B40
MNGRGSMRRWLSENDTGRRVASTKTVDSSPSTNGSRNSLLPVSFKQASTNPSPPLSRNSFGTSRTASSTTSSLPSLLGPSESASPATRPSWNGARLLRIARKSKRSPFTSIRPSRRPSSPLSTGSLRRSALGATSVTSSSSGILRRCSIGSSSGPRRGSRRRTRIGSRDGRGRRRMGRPSSSRLRRTSGFALASDSGLDSTRRNLRLLLPSSVPRRLSDLTFPPFIPTLTAKPPSPPSIEAPPSSTSTQSFSSFTSSPEPPNPPRNHKTSLTLPLLDLPLDQQRRRPSRSTSPLVSHLSFHRGMRDERLPSLIERKWRAREEGRRAVRESRLATRRFVLVCLVALSLLFQF